MKKKLFLHVGHYKTGSSALQEYCSVHADALRNCGLLYPAAARPLRNRTNHGHLSLSVARDHGFLPPPWYGQDISADDAYEALRQELEAAPETRVLISSEEFVQLALRADPVAPIADLAARLSDYDTRILLYVREPMSLLKSWFNQVNKGPVPTRNFPSFFQTVNPNFLAQRMIWKRFADGFGPENIGVLPYGEGTGGHIAAFLKTVGCDPLPVPAKEDRINEAQPPDVLEAKRLGKAGANRHQVTFSHIKNIHAFGQRAQTISDDFDALMTQLALPLRSQLSATAIFEHYGTLLGSLSGPEQYNQREADNLRDLATTVEASDLRLARAIMQAAQVIRPHGPVITRKLAEYTDALRP